MADLEAVLADVSYLMAMEKSKQSPAARASKKIVLADPRQAPNKTKRKKTRKKVEKKDVGRHGEFFSSKKKSEIFFIVS